MEDSAVLGKCWHSSYSFTAMGKKNMLPKWQYVQHTGSSTYIPLHLEVCKSAKISVSFCFQFNLIWG